MHIIKLVREEENVITKNRNGYCGDWTSHGTTDTRKISPIFCIKTDLENVSPSVCLHYEYSTFMSQSFLASVSKEET